jgi:hypothetical protein
MTINSKKAFIAIAGLSLVFLFSSFRPAQTLSHRINFLISNWDNIVSETDLSYENINSWLPERGIRGRFQVAKSVLSLETLEGITGQAVFVSGPHTTEMDYNANDFGHYNPAFLDKLYNMLQTFSQRQNFVNRSQAFYDEHFKNYLRVYYMSYEAGYNNQDVVNGYKNATGSKGYYLQEQFRGFAEEIEKQGYDVYEGFTCPGFWVRRTIDGTGDEFYKLLVLTLQTFDPEFVK